MARLKVYICLVVLLGFAAMGAAGCGKKGPPQPPEEVSWYKVPLLFVLVFF